MCHWGWRERGKNALCVIVLISMGLLKEIISSWFEVQPLIELNLSPMASLCCYVVSIVILH